MTLPREALELKRRLRWYHICQHFLLLKTKHHSPSSQSVLLCPKDLFIHWPGKDLQAKTGMEGGKEGGELASLFLLVNIYIY